MKEKNSMHISNNRLLFPASQNGLFGDSERPLNSDYQKKEKDTTKMEKDIPADHLTATYWG